MISTSVVERKVVTRVTMTCVISIRGANDDTAWLASTDWCASVTPENRAVANTAQWRSYRHQKATSHSTQEKVMQGDTVAHETNDESPIIEMSIEMSINLR
jgi:hypothetical protein